MWWIDLTAAFLFGFVLDAVVLRWKKRRLRDAMAERDAIESAARRYCKFQASRSPLN